MKKNILYIIILFSVSCNDMLNVEPENSVTYTNFFKSEQDLSSLIKGAHAFLVNTKSISPMEYAGALADKAPSGISPNPVLFMRYHEWKNQINTSWAKWYAAIYQCNVLFDNVKTNICPQERMNFYYGQANFIKAYCYFQLSKYWGDAVITGHTEQAIPSAKSNIITVLDTAIICAERAFGQLPTKENLVDYNGNKIISRQYGSKGNVATLLAHIYAWKASLINNITESQRIECLNKSITWASKVLDNDECGVYELENDIKSLVENSINTRNGKESILEFEYNAKDGSLSNVAFLTANLFVGFPIIPGDAPGDISKKQWALKNSTIMKMYPNKDERRNEFFYKPDLYTNNIDSARVCKGFAYPYKYRKQLYGTGTSAGETLKFINFDVNKHIWRVAELYLLRAECQNFIGNTEGAISDLHIIQQRAKADLYKDGDLQLAIFKEREKELIFEDQRWFDIMRNKGYYKTELPKNKIFKPFPFPREVNIEIYSLITEQEIKDGAFFLPIASSAFYLNSLMIQNKYWFNK